MNRETLIKRTMNTLSKLPPEKVEEVSDFADFLAKKHEEEIIQKGINRLVLDSASFNFLNEEEELYSFVINRSPLITVELTR